MDTQTFIKSSKEQPKVSYVQIEQSKDYLISDKSFYPKNPNEFDEFMKNFTLNPDKFLHYPENTSYMFIDDYILFKDDKDVVTKFKYVPICSVSGKLREINKKKVSSLLWSWNNNSLGITPNTELKRKVNNLKTFIDQDFKLRQFGLAFREQEFKNPIDSAIYQATVYTAWFCQKLKGYKIFFNMTGGGELIELTDEEKETYGIENIIRPYTFLVLFN